MMVLPFKRPEAGAPATYTLYGKLPNRADFVRVNADHTTAMEFDDLILRSFERLTCQRDWEKAYDASTPVEFQYVSRDFRHTFLGVLSPSSDQAGRRYPLVAGAILPSDSIAGYAHIAPIAYEVFFDGLREQVCTAVENSVEALSCRQFLESQLRANDTAAADLDLAKSVVSRFMKTTSIAKLNELLASDPCSSSLEQALLNLAFYRAFLRRFDNPATNQVIVLPLPLDKGERALVASAWLSILAALWQGKGNVEPWRGNYLMLELSTESVVLAACFDRAHEKFATIMLGSGLEMAARLDLCREQDAWKNHCLYAEVSYALGRLLADPMLSIQALCDFLRDVGSKLEGTI